MAKVDLFPDFRGLLKSFNSAGIKYLLVGGYAVIHYGYHRTTDDLDLWIAVDPQNARKVSHVLQEWGGFSAEEVPPAKFLQERALIILGIEPGRVDLLTFTTGLEFESCYARRNVVNMDGIRVPMLSLDDLRANKRASGRPKDLADLVYLTGVLSPPPKREGGRARSRKPKGGDGSSPTSRKKRKS